VERRLIASLFCFELGYKTRKGERRDKVLQVGIIKTHLTEQEFEGFGQTYPTVCFRVKDLEIQVSAATEVDILHQVSKAARSLERISRWHEKSIDPQIRTLKLYNYIHRAKGQLARVEMIEDPKQNWRRQCEPLVEMLSEVSRKLNQSKREGAIFDFSDVRLRPLQTGWFDTLST
jgi:hypothetical protein